MQPAIWHILRYLHLLCLKKKHSKMYTILEFYLFIFLMLYATLNSVQYLSSLARD